MPGRDGLILIKTPRTMKNYKNVPIVMMTAEFGDDVRAQGRAADITGWKLKAFDTMRLQTSSENRLVQGAASK